MFCGGSVSESSTSAIEKEVFVPNLNTGPSKIQHYLLEQVNIRCCKSVICEFALMHNVHAFVSHTSCQMYYSLRVQAVLILSTALSTTDGDSLNRSFKTAAVVPSHCKLSWSI